jgi:hypothetical protein
LIQKPAEQQPGDSQTEATNSGNRE